MCELLGMSANVLPISALVSPVWCSVVVEPGP